MRWGAILAAGLAVAGVATWAVLGLLGEESPYRAVHGWLGTVFLLAYVWLFRRGGAAPGPVPFFLIALLPAYAGTAFPDLDILLLGIGGHRNPLFHSALIYVLPLAMLRRLPPWPRAMLVGFALGLGSHLLWDAIDYGDVRWISGGTADRIWLIANGLICLVPPGRKHTPS